MLSRRLFAQLCRILQSKTLQAWVFLGLLLCHSGVLMGYFDEDHSPHSFFNAKLLEPGEYQISVAGQVKAGLNSEWELGTQTLAYAITPSLWNLSVKHKMFAGESYQSSFCSHSFVFQNQDGRALLSLHGVITSFAASQDQSFNLGLMDGLAMNFGRESEASLHLISPVLGYDVILSRRWALSFVYIRPIFASEREESQRFGDGRRNFDFTSGKSHPGFAMATGTVSWSSLNLEFGLFYLSYKESFILPYANLFWRFHG